MIELFRTNTFFLLGECVDERFPYSLLVLTALVAIIIYLACQRWRARKKESSLPRLAGCSQIYIYLQAAVALTQSAGWAYALFTFDTICQQLSPIIHILTWTGLLVILIATPPVHQHRATNYICSLAFLYACTFLEALHLLFTSASTNIIEQHWIYINFAICTILFIVSINVPIPLHPDNLQSVYNEHIEISDGWNYRNGKPLIPEATASIYAWVTYSWLNPLIRGGSRKVAASKGIYALTYDVQSRVIYDDFQATQSSTTNFWKRVLQTNGGLVMIRYVASLAAALFPYVAIFYQEHFLRFIEKPDGRAITIGYAYAVGICISHIIPTILQTLSFYWSRNWSTRALMIMEMEIYAKTLRRKDMSGKVTSQKSPEPGAAKDTSRSSPSYSSNGKISNLMETDASALAGTFAYFHVYLFSPIELIVGIVSLYFVLGPASFIGIGLMVLLFPFTYILSKKTIKIYEKMADALDGRSKLVNEMLHVVRTVKFYAMEKAWAKRIMKFRHAEVKQIMKTRLFSTGTNLASSMFPVIVATSSLVWYTKVAGNELTPSVAFVSITLFERILNPLERIPILVTIIAETRVQMKRITDFFDEPEVDTRHLQHNTTLRAHERDYSAESLTRTGFEASVFQWHFEGHDASSEDLSETRFQLHIPTFNFPVGQFSIIFGDTGSGKSSLLNALLGEMDLVSGHVYLPSKNRIKSSVARVDPDHPALFLDKVAYACQDPFLQHATIRDNILFGEPFEPARYKKVLFQCALVADMERWPDRDSTEIGERGVTLSGGQRQRVSLARAVYSSAKTLLLDDCLSAVDSHTARHIYEHCLMGDLIQGRTTILVTYHVALCLPSCDYLVNLAHGRVVIHGTVKEVQSAGLLQNIQAEEMLLTDASEKDSHKDVKLANMNEEYRHKLAEDETPELGSVRSSVYITYLKACGGWPFWIVIVLLAIMASLTTVAKNWWLRVWTSAYSNAPISNSTTSRAMGANGLSITEGVSAFADVTDLDYYIYVYLLICLCFVFIEAVHDTVLNWGSLRGALKIFERLLNRVMYAPMLFYDSVPLGRILNRFSKDVRIVDVALAHSFSGMVNIIIGILSSTMVISFITPEFILVGVVVGCINVALGFLYVSVTRELKRVNSVGATPIYSLFSETLDGIATIRAYSQQDRFMKTLYKSIDTYTESSYLFYSMSRWIQCRFDVLGALLTLCSSFFILWRLDRVDAGLAGISSFYAESFNSCVSMLVHQYANIEVNLTSVERLQEYMEIDQEPPAIIDGHRPPAAWPTTAAVQVRNLEVRYAPGLDAVLHDVSFDVRPHERVGVVGRTGSGKSTLALSFFRFVEPSQGSITVDGIDITSIGVGDLRSTLTILPQDPVLFSGTIQSNLDPLGDHTAAEIWEALQRVHLVRPLIETELPADQEPLAPTALRYPINSLDQPVSDRGRNFSQGERQLLCMARALLRNNRLIFMDEATSSVDFEMDARVQKTVREEFADSTLICIAHRIRTVIDYDRILVLDNGRVVEYDTPHNLLLQKGVFYSLCEQSGELDILANMAQTSATHHREFGPADDHRLVH